MEVKVRPNMEKIWGGGVASVCLREYIIAAGTATVVVGGDGDRGGDVHVGVKGRLRCCKRV